MRVLLCSLRYESTDAVGEEVLSVRASLDLPLDVRVVRGSEAKAERRKGARPGDKRAEEEEVEARVGSSGP